MYRPWTDVGLQALTGVENVVSGEKRRIKFGRFQRVFYILFQNLIFFMEVVLFSYSVLYACACVSVDICTVHVWR